MVSVNHVAPNASCSNAYWNSNIKATYYCSSVTCDDMIGQLMFVVTID